QVFGTPLVCRVIPMTGRDLYNRLFARFQRFLQVDSRKAPKSREQTTPVGSDKMKGFASSGTGTWGGARASVGGRRGGVWGEVEGEDYGPQSVRATSKWVAAGKVNQWGFRLRLVNNSGLACSRCRWSEGCVGCLIPPTDEACPMKPGDTVAVDWHMSVMKEHYDAMEALACLLHSSINKQAERESMPLSLEKCMDTFTAQEDIAEGYCSRCKELRNASLKMDIWRLPPILVIHLKRFQYTAYSRRKLRNLV
ncbi:unnamed protein product, partial [Choristocarpus tenellus]